METAMAKRGRVRRSSGTKSQTAERDHTDRIFGHFARELFDGQLPDVFITYQRKAEHL